MSDTVHPTTVVVPVYGDLPSLKDCIASLGKYVDTENHSVMLVNDCGPDAGEIEAYINKSVGGRKGFIYHRNPENLGFVGTCNRAALELDETKNDIMLLNSDTIVTKGFLEEVSSVLHSKVTIGVVSPRTNNATIATVPLASARQKGVDPTRSYEIFEKIKPYMPRYHVAPVAHGFCMLIRRSLIEQYGLFDTAFGKGYGEEVDFCMRIKEHGYSSVLSNRSYVFHLEAKSFTLETKARLLAENDKIIKQRYPDYSRIVGDYIKVALIEEGKAMRAAGIKTADLESDKFKRLIKSNRLLYGLARKLKKLF